MTFEPRVISEHPFVKLLTEPKEEIIEWAPGWTHARWTALAQVGGSLCLIEVTPHKEK